MPESLFQCSLTYGRSGRFPLELLSKRIQLHFQPPAPADDSRVSVKEAFAQPLDFPNLNRSLVADDRVVVAMERDTPAGEPIVAALIELFSRIGLSAENVRFLQPAATEQCEANDSSEVSPIVQSAGMSFASHDATVEHACTYLANTAAGERIYLARELNDADAVLTVGPVEFHPVLGIRGTSCSLYPGLSRREDLVRANARGHDELGPEDVRPLRQKADEVAWLLGLQLSVGVVPAAGTGTCGIFVGQSDSVFRRARETLFKNWIVHSSQRVEMVVVTVPADAGGHGWHQVAAAIDVGRRLVERNGRIVVLSEIDEPPGPGLEILRQARSPRDALKPIERSGSPDLLAAARIAAAADWANVSLLSRLPADLIDDLFLLPLETPQEVGRLIDQDDLTAVVENAQHCFIRCEP